MKALGIAVQGFNPDTLDRQRQEGLRVQNLHGKVIETSSNKVKRELWIRRSGRELIWHEQDLESNLQ